MSVRVFLLLGLISLFSCVNESDYDIKAVNLQPVVALPLAYGNISILELLTNKDSAYIKTYPDGLLYFYYQDSLNSNAINQLNGLKIPVKNVTVGLQLPSGTIPPNSNDVSVITVNQQIDIGLSPAQLSEMLLKSPSILGYNLAVSPPNPNVPYQVNFTLTDIVDKNTQAPLAFSASSGVGSQNLQNYIIKMNKNKFNIKLELVLKKHTNSIYISPGSNVNASLSFTGSGSNGLSYTYIKGFLGDQTATIPSQTIDISVFNSSLLKSKVSFVQPKLGLIVTNDYGVPLEVTFSKLEAQKGTSALPLQISPASPVTVNYPTTLGSSAITNISVTNPINVINFGPTQLAYSASARINKGLTGGNNFLADTSRLRIKLTAEIPLYGQASGISMLDTLNIDLSKITQADISKAALIVKATNELPLDAYIQMYLADKNYTILDSLLTTNQLYLVKASSVTGAGELQTPGTSDQKLDLATEKINKLFSSSHILIRSRLNTAKDPSGNLLNVKFKASYKLKLNVGILATLNITAR